MINEPPAPLSLLGITSMSSSQPLANIAGSPVISAPNTLATQVPAATGAQPWSHFLTPCFCVLMAMSCLALTAPQGHGSPFYVEKITKERRFKIAFHIQLYFDTWTWQKCIVAPVRIIRINLGVLFDNAIV